MKVTVRFKGIPFVVPCDDGDISVRTLIERALQRYRKFQGLTDDCNLEISKILQEKYNGILDLDDRVLDVLEDKETVVCHLKDPTTESSSPTRPDVVPKRQYPPPPLSSFHQQPFSDSSILTGAVHVESYKAGGNNNNSTTSSSGIGRLFTKRSESPQGGGGGGGGEIHKNGYHSLDRRLPANLRPNANNANNNFARNSALRRSLGGAELPLTTINNSNTNLDEFLPDSPPPPTTVSFPSASLSHPQSSSLSTTTILSHSKIICRVCLRPKSLMLAEFKLTKSIDSRENRRWLFQQIKLLPYFDSGKSHLIGLEVESLSDLSPRTMKTLLFPGDVILKINGTSLEENSFNKCLHLLEEAFYHDDIRLDILRTASTTIEDQNRKTIPLSSSPPSSPTSPLPPALPPRKRLISSETSPPLLPSNARLIPPNIVDISSIPGHTSHSHSHPHSNHHQPPPPAPVPSTAEVINSQQQPPQQQRSQPKQSDINVHNVRTIGRQLTIELHKPKNSGFGFTVTTRDIDIAGRGNKPVYIKKILPEGAAIMDGRLRVGDRLLHIRMLNSDVIHDCEALGPTGIVRILKDIPPNVNVAFVISRQMDDSNDQVVAGDGMSNGHHHHHHAANTTTNASSSNQTPSGQTIPRRPRNNDNEIVTVYLPLHSRDEPLGIEAKWFPNVSQNGGDKESVYVNSIIPGQAAAREGTLKIGDQILQLNDTRIADVEDKILANQCLVDALEKQRRFGDTVAKLVVKRTFATSQPPPPPFPTAVAPLKPRPKSALIEQHFALTDDDSDDDDERYRPSALAFIREGMGRRSMSEKRAAMEDPSRFHFYHQLKAARENNNAQQITENGADGAAYSTLPTVGRKQKLMSRAARKRQEAAAASLESNTNNSVSPVRPLVANHGLQTPTTMNQIGQDSHNVHNRGVNNNPIPLPPRKVPDMVNSIRPSSADSRPNILATSNNNNNNNSNSESIPPTTGTVGNSGVNTPTLRRGGLRNNSFRKATDKSMGGPEPLPSTIIVSSTPAASSGQESKVLISHSSTRGYPTTTSTTTSTTNNSATSHNATTNNRRNSDNSINAGFYDNRNNKSSQPIFDSPDNKKSPSKSHKSGFSQFVGLFKRGNGGKSSSNNNRSGEGGGGAAATGGEIIVKSNNKETHSRSNRQFISSPIMGSPHDFMPDSRLIERGPRQFPLSSNQATNFIDVPTADASIKLIMSPNEMAGDTTGRINRRHGGNNTQHDITTTQQIYRGGAAVSGLPRRQDSLNSHHSEENNYRSRNHNHNNNNNTGVLRQMPIIPNDSRHEQVDHHRTTSGATAAAFASPQMNRAFAAHQRRSSATAGKTTETVAATTQRHYRPIGATEDSVYATVHRTKF